MADSDFEATWYPRIGKDAAEGAASLSTQLSPPKRKLPQGCQKLLVSIEKLGTL